MSFLFQMLAVQTLAQLTRTAWHPGASHVCCPRYYVGLACDVHVCDISLVSDGPCGPGGLFCETLKSSGYYCECLDGSFTMNLPCQSSGASANVIVPSKLKHDRSAYVDARLLAVHTSFPSIYYSRATNLILWIYPFEINNQKQCTPLFWSSLFFLIF